MKQRGQNGTLMINCSYKRSGYFKKDRFKSVIVDRKETLVNSFAYIDLNPLWTGIEKQPGKYRWNPIGYHLQTNNRNSLL
jgi:hypothetical protein